MSQIRRAERRRWPPWETSRYSQRLQMRADRRLGKLQAREWFGDYDPEDGVNPEVFERAVIDGKPQTFDELVEEERINMEFEEGTYVLER